LAQHYEFEECDPTDRYSCREFGREYCCATYHIPSDVESYYAITYGEAQASSLFAVTTGCEISPSYYNFTQWVYEAYDIGYYTCREIASGATDLNIKAVTTIAAFFIMMITV
jgi:hypothetical protein